MNQEIGHQYLPFAVVRAKKDYEREKQILK